MSEKTNHMPHGAGKSSYDLVDLDKVFRELKLRKGLCFLDMACGPGDYTIEVARMIGDQGVVYLIIFHREGLDGRKLVHER